MFVGAVPTLFSSGENDTFNNDRFLATARLGYNYKRQFGRREIVFALTCMSRNVTFSNIIFSSNNFPSKGEG